MAFLIVDLSKKEILLRLFGVTNTIPWKTTKTTLQLQSAINHEADYCAQTNAGEYEWISDIVYVVWNAAGNVE